MGNRVHEPVRRPGGDHSRKAGLRTSSKPSPPADSIMYGPVAGTGSMPWSSMGVPAGTGYAKGSVSLKGMSGSGRARWMVTASSSTMTDPERSQAAGSAWHSRAPSIARMSAVASRLTEACLRPCRKSSGRTGSPVEYRIPSRSGNR